MGSKIKMALFIIACVAIIGGSITAILLMNQPEAFRKISVYDLAGQVTITNEKDVTYDASPDMSISAGYVMDTAEQSYARLVLDDSKYVKLHESGKLVFTEIGTDENRKTALELSEGALTVEASKALNGGESFEVNTPNAVISIRGTMYYIRTGTDEQGMSYTDVFTYGGEVGAAARLADGSASHFDSTLSAGSKIRITMNGEKNEPGDVQPIELSSDISDDDLAAMLDASVHGHKLYLSTDQIVTEIIERGIDVSSYKSFRGDDLVSFITTTAAVQETETEAVTEEITEPETTTTTTEKETEEETELTEESEETEAVTTTAPVTTTTVPVTTTVPPVVYQTYATTTVTPAPVYTYYTTTSATTAATTTTRITTTTTKLTTTTTAATTTTAKQTTAKVTTVTTAKTTAKTTAATTAKTTVTNSRPGGGYSGGYTPTVTTPRVTTVTSAMPSETVPKTEESRTEIIVTETMPIVTEPIITEPVIIEPIISDPSVN